MKFTFKTLTTGDGGVGKTSLLKRYVSGTFDPSNKMTIGVEFHIKRKSIGEDEAILSLWDFGGEERFRFLLPAYARKANGAILMFDLTRINTLDNIGEWVKVCREFNPNIPILFLGAKSDLKDKREVKQEYIEEIKNKFNFFDYLEISSKNGENVEDAFMLILDKMLKISLSKI